MKSHAEPLAPGLYLVATPIGSARDITLRALDVLATADVIAAEDTRRARKLLQIHGIALGGRQVVAYHDHSGEAVRSRLGETVRSGGSVAYVSDAGTPLVADPGFALARAVTEAGGAVTAVPGASALLAGLSVAGLPTDRFLFVGFLPAKAGARQKALAELRDIPATLVFFESPKRVGKILGEMVQVLGDREAAVCRELTKRFETVYRGTLASLAADLSGAEVKGECVVVVDRSRAAADEDDLDGALMDAMKTMRIKDAATAVAGATGRPRREVYQRALELTKK